MEIVFYRNKEKPNYYLLYKGKNGVNAKKMLRKLTNVGEYENSGFDMVNVEIGYILKTELGNDFFEFITLTISSNHIDNPSYNDETFKAWCEFKSFEPEKWMSEFNAFQNSKIDEYSDESLPPFHSKVYHLFRVKVYQHLHTYITKGTLHNFNISYLFFFFLATSLKALLYERKLSICQGSPQPS